MTINTPDSYDSSNTDGSHAPEALSAEGAPPAASAYLRSQAKGAEQRRLATVVVLLGLLVMVLLIGRTYFAPFSHVPQSGVEERAGTPDGLTPEMRKPAPNIKFFTSDGRPKSLKDFSGKVVLLSFWASWCGPCIEELPVFSKLVNKYQSQGFVVVPVNVDDSIEEAKSFVADFWKNKALAFPTFFDERSVASRAYQVEVLPSNFVLDRQGRIALLGMGFHDWTAAESLQEIEDLLAEN